MSLKQVTISCFSNGLPEHSSNSAIVAIDVIRATTTAITAVSAGRKCYPVPTAKAALDLAVQLPDALLAGELDGTTPDGFEITNSPAQIARRSDVFRPMILLSSSGTRLIKQICDRDFSYVACFRNYTATIEYLAEHHESVLLIGAGTRGEFREEDQMCCAWIAGGLMKRGFTAHDNLTMQLVQRWRGAARDAFFISRSVDYLRRSNQLQDLDFILAHFDDLDAVFKLGGQQVEALAITEKVCGV
ncbi:MAG TPA: 2-phosphosulfolactate phosphatase [Terriglobia bacterium]|nr:2-phosphosulfolactate phosphatase [Terriglobia bacterium]